MSAADDGCGSVPHDVYNLGSPGRTERPPPGGRAAVDPPLVDPPFGDPRPGLRPALVENDHPIARALLRREAQDEAGCEADDGCGITVGRRGCADAVLILIEGAYDAVVVGVGGRGAEGDGCCDCSKN